jgi:membrane-associated phospholipid phosphatase
VPWWALVLTLAAFVALAVAAHHIPYFAFDLPATLALQSFRSPVLDRAAEWLGWPGFPPQSNLIFGALVLLLASRHVLAAVFELFAAGGSAALWFAIAPLVNRPRPSADVVYVSGQLPAGSFPSGHVLNLTAGLGFAWFLAYTFLPQSWWRTTILWLLPLYMLLLGVARVYSGQHWSSDVIGGYLAGALWLWVSVALFRWATKKVHGGMHRKADRAALAVT